MKRAQVRPGLAAVTTVGRKRVAVWVSYRRFVAGERGGKLRADTWAVVDNDGRYYDRTPRQLRAV